MRVRCRRADYDVGAVYSYEADVVPEQLVSLVKLDLEKILHIRNFWLRHLMDSDEGTFYESFSSLPEWHRPKGRKRSPDQVSELSMYWLGYYCQFHQR